MSKPCSICNQVLPLENFANQSTGKQGKRASCKECVKNTYQRTKKGLVINMHSNQRAKSKKRGHVQPNYTKEQLLNWCLTQDIFHDMYRTWQNSNYDMWHKPTCDRLNDTLPYSLDNIQLLTFIDNTRKGAQDLVSGKNSTIAMSPVVCLNLDGTYHCEYHSLATAARAVGTTHANIRNVCEGTPIKRTEKDGTVRYFTPKTSKGFIWKYK